MLHQEKQEINFHLQHGAKVLGKHLSLFKAQFLSSSQNVPEENRSKHHVVFLILCQYSPKLNNVKNVNTKVSSNE